MSCDTSMQRKLRSITTSLICSKKFDVSNSNTNFDYVSNFSSVASRTMSRSKASNKHISKLRGQQVLQACSGQSNQFSSYMYMQFSMWYLRFIMHHATLMTKPISHFYFLFLLNHHKRTDIMTVVYERIHLIYIIISPKV